MANAAANAAGKNQAGVQGHPNAIQGGNVNLSANDGTITRFGWKAQNKSLLMFAGEAYNPEHARGQGLGQRISFLYDGRTSDLMAAIEAHRSQNSEANGVIQRSKGLTETQQQDILNSLRAL
jgi:CxxC motif-containing protein (DUF1111 family)